MIKINIHEQIEDIHEVIKRTDITMANRQRMIDKTLTENKISSNTNPTKNRAFNSGAPEG
jgi:hypothetical protein